MPMTEEPLDSSIDWVAEHTRRYVETGGEEGHIWRGVPTLVLTTMGRRSGKPRRNALIYGRDGDRVLLVASRGGDPRHPHWYLNLVDHPEVEVQIGPDRFTGRAHTATQEEKGRYWPMMAEIWPAYDEYQAKTSRDIPVVVLDHLEPIDG